MHVDSCNGLWSRINLELPKMRRPDAKGQKFNESFQQSQTTNFLTWKIWCLVLLVRFPTWHLLTEQCGLLLFLPPFKGVTISVSLINSKQIQRQFAQVYTVSQVQMALGCSHPARGGCLNGMLVSSWAGQWHVGGNDQYRPASVYTLDPSLSEYDAFLACTQTYITKQVNIRLMAPRRHLLPTPLLSNPIIVPWRALSVTQQLSSLNYRLVQLFFVELMSMNKPEVKL